MYQMRLMWDTIPTDWADVPDEYVQQLANGDTRLIQVRLPAPTHWEFNLDMLKELNGHVAVESTSLMVEIRHKSRRKD